MTRETSTRAERRPAPALLENSRATGRRVRRSRGCELAAGRRKLARARSEGTCVAVCHCPSWPGILGTVSDHVRVMTCSSGDQVIERADKTVRPQQVYSQRSATVGSTRVARRAGTYDAAMATAANIVDAMTNVLRS